MVQVGDEGSGGGRVQNILGATTMEALVELQRRRVAAGDILPTGYVVWFEFQPFESRVGDTVVGVRFAYDRRLVDLMKTTIKLHTLVERAQRCRRAERFGHGGGWLASSGCWFVEMSIWSQVAVDLAAGLTNEHRLVQIARPVDVVHHGVDEPLGPGANVTTLKRTYLRQ